MTTTTENIEIPTIADLLWEADRRSLLELDDDTRQLLEKMGDAIAELWPVLEVELEPPCAIDDHDDWDAFVGELVEQGGVKIADDVVRTEAEVLEAVKTTIENARAEGEKDATIPSRANTAQRKAMRLLLEQRVAISVIDLTVPYVVAEVRGDSGVYMDRAHGRLGRTRLRLLSVGARRRRARSDRRGRHDRARHVGNRHAARLARRRPEPRAAEGDVVRRLMFDGVIIAAWLFAVGTNVRQGDALTAAIGGCGLGLCIGVLLIDVTRRRS